MSQHDYNITTQPPAALLADLNAALCAIATNNSGAAAPNPSFPYQWWADTRKKLLRIRNATNTAWVTVGKLSDPNLGLALAGGSATQDFAARNLAVAGTLTVNGAGLDFSAHSWTITAYSGISFISGSGSITGKWVQAGKLVQFFIYIKDDARGALIPNGVVVGAGATLNLSLGNGVPPYPDMYHPVHIMSGEPSLYSFGMFGNDGGIYNKIFLPPTTGQANVGPTQILTGHEGIIFVSGSYLTP